MYKKTKKLALTLSILTLCIAINCKNPGITDDQSGFVTFKIGDAHLQRADAPLKEIILKDEILPGDIIVTGDKSVIAIQFGEHCLIRLDQKTTFKILSIDSRKLEMLTQEGTTFNKLSQKSRITLLFKTLTTLAAIRGTTFSISYRNGISEVAVSEGNVSVSALRHNSSGEAISSAEKEATVKAGNTAVITEARKKGLIEAALLELKLRPISKTEKNGLKKVDAMPFIPEVKNKSTRQVEETQKAIIIKDKEIDMNTTSGIDREELNQLIVKKNRTLNDIRQVFDGIDEVTLHNGSVINGAILSRGETYRIITPKGIINIQKSDIKNLIKK